MSEVKLKNNSEKLKDLQASLAKLKEGLNGTNQDIQQAIKAVSETWKDFKFNEFKEDYQKYIVGIAKFEKDLESAAKETLPPLIKAAEEYEKTH